jgi:hypothetical protein
MGHPEVVSQPGTCSTCGAPDNGEFATCHFCNAPFSKEIAGEAIPCPSCGAQCRAGKQKCAACSAWIVVACVFCGATSPHNVPACLSCHEVFAGAPQRKADLDRQKTFATVSNEASQVVGTVGSLLEAVVDAERLVDRFR